GKACNTSAGEGRSRGLTAPLAETAHHAMRTTAATASLGQICAVQELARDNLLHLLLELIVDVPDDAREEHVLERARARDSDPVLGHEPPRPRGHQQDPVGEEDGCANVVGAEQ